jgi:hypothetical protein
MPYRSMKVGKTTGSAAPQEKTETSRAKLMKNSFDDAFAAAFKQMNDSQSAFSKMGNMQISFKKNLFNPVIPMPATTAPASPTAATGASSGSGFKDILKVIMRHEGTAYVRMDGGRESSKMGILQSTAMQYGYAGDIKDITKSQAEAIYKKIWVKSGAANLPYPLSAIHFDTYVNSPAAARKFLKQSGGDIDTYLQMREQRYIHLATLSPQKYGKYLNGWMNRVSDLRMVAAEYSKTQQAGQVKIATADAKNTTT